VSEEISDSVVNRFKFHLWRSDFDEATTSGERMRNSVTPNPTSFVLLFGLLLEARR
jgi:hypothetical protein